MILIPYGTRLRDLASRRPDATALVAIDRAGTERVLTWEDLYEHARSVSVLLREWGVDRGHLVAVALPNAPEHVAACFGAWLLGATVMPVNPAAPPAELAALLRTAEEFRPVVTVGHPAGDTADIRIASLAELPEPPAEHLAEVVADPAQVMGSGGTSGTPKVTVGEGSAVFSVDADGSPVLPPLLEAFGVGPGQVHLVCTPLHHTNGFGMLVAGLLIGNSVVLVDRFDAGLVLDTIERHRVSQTLVVPAVLQRLAAQPDIAERDLRSLESVAYGGAPCPEWLTRRWIELIGAEHLYAGYGATEYHGKTVLRGDEWLSHPGSSGRPVGSDLRILDRDGRELPPGEVGEIFMRPHGAVGPAFRYLGDSRVRVTDDGFVSLGDEGWVDEDGYLYVADRRTDLILSGGANVYPAEVEAALSEHPQVRDVAVIGLPDERWGQRVHAIVETDGVAEQELDAWCRERLSAYKCPKTYELVEQLPRTGAGKVSRSRLTDERVAR